MQAIVDAVARTGLGRLALGMVTLWALLSIVEVGIRLYDRAQDTHELTTDELASGFLRLNNRLRAVEKKLDQLARPRVPLVQFPINLSRN